MMFMAHLPSRPSPLPTTTAILNASNKTPSELIIDSLALLTRSWDLKDPALLFSVTTPDVVFDLSIINKTLGFNFTPDLVGQQAVANGILHILRDLETMHYISNCHVDFAINAKGQSPGEAKLTRNALAQHFRKAEARDITKNDFFAVGSRYEVDIIEDSNGAWKIKRLVVKPVWTCGEVEVMKGADETNARDGVEAVTSGSRASDNDADYAIDRAARRDAGNRTFLERQDSSSEDGSDYFRGTAVRSGSSGSDSSSL